LSDTNTAMPAGPLKLGMVGGGQGAFIGAVHRMAAALDGKWAFVAGALSSTPERSMASGRALGLAEGRNYGTWKEMVAGESKLPKGERIDAVSIVTPNASHAEIAEAFVRAGFHVVLDKPMTATLAEAERLREAVKHSGVVLCVTYNYTGYPMVREAAARVRSGTIGAVRKVFVEYHQGWLAKHLEGTGQKQAAWRTDPALAGGGGAIGDIGTHAENLVHTITGLEIESLCADLTSFVPGRKLDDDASVLLRFKGGAKGVLTASQVCVGEQNALTIRVHGEKGSLAWRQETPERLEWAREDGTVEVTVRGVGGIAPGGASDSRLPPGHPEGFIEAFANVYAGAAEAIHAKSTKGRFPGIEDGVRGVRFVTRVVESSRAGGAWAAF
jgi:predicted dehydrogenase